MNDEQQDVGFFRGLWAVGRGILRGIGKLLSGVRRVLTYGVNRFRDTSDDDSTP